jgi:hypothetical protein
MKAAFILTMLVLGNVCSFAAETIRVDAKIIDGPAALLLTKRDFETKARLKYPDLNVLTAPSLVTFDGQSGVITIQENRPVRTAKDDTEIQIPSGVQLKVLPKLNGERIDFTANVTVRNLEKSEKTATGEEVEFSSREFYFSGSCKEGAAVVVRSKGIHNNRRVSLFLVFSRPKANPSP